MKILFSLLSLCLSIHLLAQDKLSVPVYRDTSAHDDTSIRYFIDDKRVHPAFMSVLDLDLLDSKPKFEVANNEYNFDRILYKTKKRFPLSFISLKEFKEYLGFHGRATTFFVNGSALNSFIDTDGIITNTEEDYCIIPDIIREAKIRTIKDEKGSSFDLIVLHILGKERQFSYFTPVRIAKPAIYLYPETTTNIHIKHNFAGEIVTTYPDYGNGWTVMAEPNGKVKNLKDGRTYSYLFWDGDYTFPLSHYDYKDGFYVSKSEYTSFLLKKLAHIGLNDVEINDFIVYWLPELNKYEEVFIHFRINDNIGNSSELVVDPTPDTMIRIFMEFKEFCNEEKLPEQELPAFSRNKFTLLEWGGAEIGYLRLR